MAFRCISLQEEGAESGQVGFSLANSHRNSVDPAELVGQKGQLPEEVDVLLMQKTMTVANRDDDDVLFLQALPIKR